MDGNAKQAVAEKLRSSSSVLVTVSNDPTVDQLASALGLSLMLTKLGKHTTTVFSGKMPNTMEFLDPNSTFDTTVDGLRDFIISLDKDKADKLRYKVEDDVVKVFITPYKSKITSDDLNFSQGDFNVDLVVALGVHKRDELDNAITSHGRILHDATIATINSGKGIDGNLGAVDWTDENASCLSEMLVSISEALEGGILDKQMSTAFLTGIVAATERFKNEATTPKVMTMAAQLMAAGANQQLIATNLQMKEPEAKPEPAKESNSEKSGKNDENSDAEEGMSVAIDRDSDAKSSKKKQKHNTEPKKKPVVDEQEDESMLDHLIETPAPLPSAKKAPELNDEDLLSDIESAVHAKHNKLDSAGRTEKMDGEDPAIKALEDELSNDSSSSLIDLEGKLKSYDPHNPARPKSDQIDDVKTSSVAASDSSYEPSMGGTFNATSQQAHDQINQDREKSLNSGILSHDNPMANAGVNPGEISTHGKDIPVTADIMSDLEAARREVDNALDESEFNTPMPAANAALNAAPMNMDDQGMNAMDFSVPAPSPQQMQQPQMQQPFNQQPMGPAPMPAPQMPQQQFPPQQQPMNNPMFTQQQPPQQQMGPAQMPAPQMQPGMQQLPPQQMGNMQGPPPMPPAAPPPMPPFN